MDSPILPHDTWIKVTLLLVRCSRKLPKACAGANMVFSRLERVSILKLQFPLKSSDTVQEEFGCCLSWRGSTEWDTGTSAGNRIWGTGSVSMTSVHRATEQLTLTAVLISSSASAAMTADGWKTSILRMVFAWRCLYYKNLQIVRLLTSSDMFCRYADVLKET